MSETLIPRHPLPYQHGSGWVRLQAEGHEERDGGKPIRLLVGSSVERLSRAELAALYTRIDAILNAPYRLIIAGGDTVPEDKLHMIGPWLDGLKEGVSKTGWRMQVVTRHANDAQSAVASWCRLRGVEVLVQPALCFAIGGNAVGLLPTVDPISIVKDAHHYGIPTYHVAARELWKADR